MFNHSRIHHIQLIGCSEEQTVFYIEWTNSRYLCWSCWH